MTMLWCIFWIFAFVVGIVEAHLWQYLNRSLRIAQILIQGEWQFRAAPNEVATEILTTLMYEQKKKNTYQLTCLSMSSKLNFAHAALAKCGIQNILANDFGAFCS
jgi:hypothetical protein